MQKINFLNSYLLVSPAGMYVGRYILLLCEFYLQKTQKAQWIWTVKLFKSVQKKVHEWLWPAPTICVMNQKILFKK